LGTTHTTALRSSTAVATVGTTLRSELVATTLRPVVVVSATTSLVATSGRVVVIIHVSGTSVVVVTTCGVALVSTVLFELREFDSLLNSEIAVTSLLNVIKDVFNSTSLMGWHIEHRT
jgi:hypothetical protein